MVEHLSSKHKTLSSVLSSDLKKKKKKRCPFVIPVQGRQKKTNGFLELPGPPT